jgi:K+-transporting ATPase A subunit
MSYLSQMIGLARHNFVSAAVGISLSVAFMRGLVRTDRKMLGCLTLLPADALGPVVEHLQMVQGQTF